MAGLPYAEAVQRFNGLVSASRSIFRLHDTRRIGLHQNCDLGYPSRICALIALRVVPPDAIPLIPYFGVSLVLPFALDNRVSDKRSRMSISGR